MLERVVGRMFRSATRSSQETRTEEKMGPSGNSGDDKTVPTQSPGDIEIDNSNHVLVKIATLYAERLMNDICLVVQGIEYPAHRLILCASSEVFQVMLMNPQWSESHLSRVELKETPACAAIFGQFLRYFYTGQIRINHLTIMPVLALADKYNVKDLITLCVDYMCGHIAHAATHNQLISWFQYTLSLGHYQVAQACQNFVKWNLEIVAETSDFGNFHHEILARLLQQNDLVVHNEMTVFRCVVRWLELQHEQLLQSCSSMQSDEGDAGCSSSCTDGCTDGCTSDSCSNQVAEEQNNMVEAQMEALVEQVMSHVRFPMMSPRQLAELLMSPLTKKYKEFFIERMAIGMSFHSGHTDRIQQIVYASEGDTSSGREGEGRLLFTPRLYTADNWSSLLTVENFGALQAYHTRTLVFSSHAGLAECNGERSCEWVVDLYPKGVWFRKYFLIVWQGTVEVPESVLRTVRLSITCKDPPENEDLRVKVGILINGIQDGVEHVMSVMQRNHRFSEKEKVLNLDDVLAFDELNQVCSFSPSSSASSTSSAPSSSTNKAAGEPSPYLVGPNRDILKIHIIIAPLCEFSSIEPPDQTLIVPTR